MKRVVSILTIVLVAGSVAGAAATASWTAPPDGSVYSVGSIVTPNGIASGVGQVGGTGLDLALVIDVSGSMGYSPHYALNNYAKPAAIAMVNNMPQDTSSVAVVPFAGTSSIRTPLTPLNPDKQTVINGINSLSAGGSTNIGAGVAKGEEAINAGHTAGRTKMQVVLSDGVGSYSGQASTAYTNSGIITHAVGVPGHNATQMQTVATDGHGIYTNVSDLNDLISLFDGTGGNLVGLHHIDILMPDGSLLENYATDGLGNFTLPEWSMLLGPNTFQVNAYGTDQTSATAYLTLTGVSDQPVIPAPGALLLGGIGASLVGWMRRRRTL